MTSKKRIAAALDIADRFGGIDGDHHKAWVIDQMVRALTGCKEGQDTQEYLAFLDKATEGVAARWDCGIAP